MAEACVSRRAYVATAEPFAEELPFISVIVPVRNEESFIEATLGQLLRQHYDPERFEILVADGESTDATPDLVRGLAKDHPNLRLLANPGRYSSAGRNAGLAAARGDIVLIVDGHCDVNDPNHLRSLAQAFARSGAECVGRPQPLDVSRATPLQRAIAAARSSRLGHNPSSFIYASEEGYVSPLSVAVAYRRVVFERVGAFDDRFDACEDVEFNHRVEQAGMRCFFTPRVAVRYHPRSSLPGLFRQMARYGRGRVRLLRKHPGTFSLPCFLPALFLIGVVAGPLVAWLSPWLAGGYAGFVGAYLVTLVLTGVFLSVKKRDVRLLPWLLLVFVAIHFGAGLGVLSEAVAGRGSRRERRPRWRVQEQLP
jgi:succinoglycan biosynthesis protein ExoA